LEQQQGQNPTGAFAARDLGANNLVGQVRAWMWLRDKRAHLESARRLAQEMGTELLAQHDALQRRVREEKPQKEETKQQAVELRKGAAAGAVSKETTATAVNSLSIFPTTRSCSPTSTSAFEISGICRKSTATGSV